MQGEPERALRCRPPYEMILEDARRESVLPGGATCNLLDVYAFIPSYVFYPQPGCYQAANSGHRIPYQAPDAVVHAVRVTIDAWKMSSMPTCS